MSIASARNQHVARGVKSLAADAPRTDMIAKTIRTDVLPVHQRLRFLRTSMSELNFDCRIEPTGNEPINTRIIAHVAEEFRLVKVAFTAHRTENVVMARRRRPADTFLISLHQHGEIDVSQDGRSARIGPQELFFIDTTRPFTINAGQMRCLSLYISGAKLAFRFARARPVHC